MLHAQRCHIAKSAWSLSFGYWIQRLYADVVQSLDRIGNHPSQIDKFGLGARASIFMVPPAQTSPAPLRAAKARWIKAATLSHAQLYLTQTSALKGFG